MERIDTAAAARVLTAILDQPGGAASIFEALAELGGIQHDPGRTKSWLRAAVPPSLSVGDWVFSAEPSGTAVGVQHSVRGVVLSRSTQPAVQAAGLLAAALAELARQQGPETALQLQAWLDGWAELLGLPR